jgi:UDP-N-acetylmuramoyl-tripeptide--D-alanyl-D-alanine ligase
MQKHLIKLLGGLAALVVHRHAPLIVAVTGSVGKTSARSAIAAVLARSFRVRASTGNFNNELGVPLTILGVASAPGRSPFAWAALFFRAFRLAYGRVDPDFPKVLVLEMGADHPGDLMYLAAIAPPDVAVITAVAEAHTEYFGSIDGVAEEKGTLVEVLPERGWAVLNADDPRVAAMADRTGAGVMRYGLGSDADVRAENVTIESAMGTVFTRFGLVMDGQRFETTLSGAVGTGAVSAALAGAAVASVLGVDPKLIPFGLAAFQPAPGRLRVLSGIKKTTILDDSYNASPRAAGLALDTLMALPADDGARRIAVMGDMLELGALTEEAHRQVGAKAADAGVDVLIGVGPRSKSLCDGARERGMSQDLVFHMHDALEASHFLQDRLRPGDVILIKGSRGMRMERAVKDLMSEPERADELLVHPE